MKKYTLTPLLFLMTLGLTNLQGDETKWIAIGQLHDWFSDGGSEIEVGRRHLIPDQQDGLQWPAQYRYQDVKAAKAFWIGAANYSDPLSGQTYTAKVVHVGPRVLNELSEFMPQDFRLLGRYKHPLVYVDGLPGSDMDYLDIVDDVNENLPSDRLLINTVNTSLGITMTRKIYAYSRPGFDNFYIYVYSFKNTGIYDLEGDTHSLTLDGVTFFWQERYAMTKEACAYGFYWLPQNATWGRNTMNEVIGEDALYGVGYSDPYRASYSWQGRHSGWTGPGDNIGAPYFSNDGHLGASQFAGVMTIHADVSATDNSDDPYQPTSTPYPDSDGPYNSGNDHFDAVKMADEYALMTSGHPSLSQAEEVGSGNADQFGPTGGGYSQGRGYGPYTLAPGDSIVIVSVEAVAGLSRKMHYLVGADWLSGAISNQQKNDWVMTGIDSLFESFSRAQEVYNNGLEINHEPPPPDQFTVTSGGDRIILEWTNSAESWPNFAGYRLYRTISVPDTTFDLLAELGPGETRYEDRTAIRGFDYYYYVTTVDDGSTNDLHPGQPMESSLFYTRTNEPAFLRRPAGNSMDDIRVVPNPYNIRARDLQYGSESGKDRIMFLNIPPVCTIRIFTERGDLVETLEHVDGSGDEAWNSITSYRQVVVSGLYIAQIETPEGESHIEKFIIIR
ncbi:MAG: hypothetical protein GXO90_09345 [FCB group bacterium]|nr:hypothetical protein [FCB group bacterium]